MHGYLQGTGESREPWSRELGSETGVRSQGDRSQETVLTTAFSRLSSARRSSSRLASKEIPKAALQSVDRLVAVRDQELATAFLLKHDGRLPLRAGSLFASLNVIRRPCRFDLPGQRFDVDGAGGVDFQDRAEGGRVLRTPIMRSGGHCSEGVRRVVALLTGAFGETGGRLLREEGGNRLRRSAAPASARAVTLARSYGLWVRKFASSTTAGQCGASAQSRSMEAAPILLENSTSPGGPCMAVKRVSLMSSFGEEREAEAFGERPREGGLAGGGRTGDEDDAMFPQRTHRFTNSGAPARVIPSDTD